MSATQAWGGVASLILFVISFLGVHAVKLSSKGYSAYRQEEKKTERTAPSPEPKPTPPKQEQPAPVYYLVEKKRARKKPATEYTEPKRIRFQEEEEKV